MSCIITTTTHHHSTQYRFDINVRSSLSPSTYACPDWLPFSFHFSFGRLLALGPWILSWINSSGRKDVVNTPRSPEPIPAFLFDIDTTGSPHLPPIILFLSLSLTPHWGTTQLRLHLNYFLSELVLRTYPLFGS